MIRRPLVAGLAALFAQQLGSFRNMCELHMQPMIDALRNEFQGNRSTRGPGRRRAGKRVPRVGGIAHPPTARLRACGHWGRR